MNSAERGLEANRSRIEAMRRDGWSWRRIGAEIGLRPETVRGWCAEWMDADLMRPVRSGPVPLAPKPKKGDVAFAEAMAGRRFASMKLTPDRRMAMQAPSGYVPREANS